MDPSIDIQPKEISETRNESITSSSVDVVSSSSVNETSGPSIDSESSHTNSVTSSAFHDSRAIYNNPVNPYVEGESSTIVGSMKSFDSESAKINPLSAARESSPHGRYVKLDSRLGSGAYKDVWRAYDTNEGT
jgi:hypothetical protein